MFRTETKTMKLILHRFQGLSPKEQSLTLFFTALSITRRALQDSTLVHTRSRRVTQRLVAQKPIHTNPTLKVNQGVCSTLIFGKTLH